MKFVISANTVTELNARSATTMRELGVDNDLAAMLTAPPTETTGLANMSVTQTNDEWTVEINDEVLFKYLRVYIRIAQFVVPFITPLTNLMFSIKEDLAEIEEFISRPKP